MISMCGWRRENEDTRCSSDWFAYATRCVTASLLQCVETITVAGAGPRQLHLHRAIPSGYRAHRRGVASHSVLSESRLTNADTIQAAPRSHDRRRVKHEACRCYTIRRRQGAELRP